MSAPLDLVLRAGEASHVVVAAGAALPARGRVVCATQRAGQRELLLELLEGPERRLIARARFALPPGLPANCWIPVEVALGEDLRVRAHARENLRRISVEGALDAEGASATRYGIAPG